VIVEVKTRTTTAFGSPAEAITYRKADKLRELALTWLRDHPERGRAVRFDVICIVIPKYGAPQLEHLRGVL
jgi:putative endonuclease